MSNVAEKTETGKVSDSDEEEGESLVTVESALSSTARYAAKYRYVTWIKILAFDRRINDAVKCVDPRTEMAITTSRTKTAGEAFGEGSRSTSRGKTRKSSSSSEKEDDFPPLLSIFNVNGRLRYDFVRRSENGRLQIEMMLHDRPELLATVHKSGRLTLSFIKRNDLQDDDDEEVEEGSTSTFQDEESKIEVELDGRNGGDKLEELHGSHENTDD